MEKFIPGLLAPQGVDVEAGAPDYCGGASDGGGDTRWQGKLGWCQRGHNRLPEVISTLGGRRGLEGNGEGTVAGLAVDAEMSATEAGTDGGGAFLSLGFVV